jgi:tetratricopeptide (TPR) repeat protein
MERVVEKALAKAPADRYSTTLELAEALQRASMELQVGRAAWDRRPMPRRGVVVGLVGVVAIGALATVVVRELVPPAAEEHHLAVLPCANRMGDLNEEYKAAGVHDEIVTGLGGIAAVEVRGRISVMRYRDTAVSPPEIARDLGVGSLVECSVYRAGGDSMRITASLLDAPGDRQLWSGAFQRPAAEVFLLGGDVARGVAEALNADLTPNERARVAAQPTENQEALTHYHRGRYLIDSWTPEGILAGTDHFEQAIALDSNFALAYTGLADAIMLRGDLVALGDIKPIDYMPRVRELVLRARELDPELAEAPRLLGWIRFIYDYDYEAVDREFRRATELDPTSAAAWSNYGEALSAMGRDEDANVAGRRAIELDPVTPWILNGLSATLNIAGEHQEALETANAAIELEPDFAPAYWNAADASLLLGDSNQAIALYEQSQALSPQPVFLGNLGGAYARIGNREAALRILDELLELREQRYVPPRAFAYVYLGMDSLDTAMDWLILGAETRDPWIHWHIRHPIDRDKVRDHPRYPELLRVLRLEQ